MANETVMNKPLDGAGLAIVNQIFNERLSELGGGSSGVNWETTPYTSMTFLNNSDVFCCVLLSTERRNTSLRYVKGTVIVHVKSASYSGSQQITVTLPGGFPPLTFAKVSNNLPQITGTGTVNMGMTGSESKVVFDLNSEKAAVSSGLYIGGISKSIIG